MNAFVATGATDLADCRIGFLEIMSLWKGMTIIVRKLSYPTRFANRSGRFEWDFVESFQELSASENA